MNDDPGRGAVAADRGANSCGSAARSGWEMNVWVWGRPNSNVWVRDATV